MQYSSQNAALPYQYPCYIATNMSYFIDMAEGEDAKKRVAGLKGLS